MRIIKTITLYFLFFIPATLWGGTMKSIREFGVQPHNTPAENRVNLQRAIDETTVSGGVLWVEPVEGGYPIEAGLVLKKNVSLTGAHGPTGRGARHPELAVPTGSLFKITGDEKAFVTVESATQLKGLQFWYPEQTHTDPDRIIRYKPTIQVAKDQSVYGVTLSNLTFYGEYIAMDFYSDGNNINELVLFEHCYGYPLSGEFIRINRRYDIPRILHCHVNPSNMREFGRTFSKRIVDAVIANKTFTFWLDHTDNAQLIDVFTFGAYGGIYLGPETYGQLTNFNLDCVTVGIEKDGANTKCRNWQIAQGSIIANTGVSIEDVHPFIIRGLGHTAITNVEAFSGDNAALTTLDQSFDFMRIEGDQLLTVSLFGCRMRNYVSDQPFTIANPHARIQAVACVDKQEELYNILIDRK